MKKLDVNNRSTEELLALMYLTHIEEKGISEEQKLRVLGRLDELIDATGNKQLVKIREEMLGK